MRPNEDYEDDPPKSNLVTFIALLLIAVIVIFAAYRMTRNDADTPPGKVKITIEQQ